MSGGYSRDHGTEVKKTKEMGGNKPIGEPSFVGLCVRETMGEVPLYPGFEVTAGYAASILVIFNFFFGPRGTSTVTTCSTWSGRASSTTPTIPTC